MREGRFAGRRGVLGETGVERRREGGHRPGLEAAKIDAGRKQMTATAARADLAQATPMTATAAPAASFTRGHAAAVFVPLMVAQIVWIGTLVWLAFHFIL
jgi:hypothetical protein